MHRFPGLAICCLLLWPALAPGQSPTASLRFDERLPTELPLVCAARLAGFEGRLARLQSPQLSPPEVVAQRDSQSGRYWFVAAIRSRDLLGKSWQLPALPCDVPDRVTIASGGEGVRFLDDGRPVLVYQPRPQSRDGGHTRAGFVHPLWGLGGEPLTQVFPDDHPHHHGVFWAWHQLWVGDRRAGDPWVTQDFLAVVQQTQILDQGPVFARLRAVVHWTSPRVTDDNGSPRAIVEETTSIRLFRASASAQCVDFEIRLKPLLAGVRIGGAENARGYSGFTVRVRPPAEMQIRSDQGLLSEDAVGTAGRWADVSGRFGDDAAVTGLAILAHRALPEFPPRWLLRHYGMQNVVYPGREPIELSAEKPLVLRHRLLIHRGDAAAARVADQQVAYEIGP